MEERDVLKKIEKALQSRRGVVIVLKKVVSEKLTVQIPVGLRGWDVTSFSLHHKKKKTIGH